MKSRSNARVFHLINHYIERTWRVEFTVLENLDRACRAAQAGRKGRDDDDGRDALSYLTARRRLAARMGRPANPLGGLLRLCMAYARRALAWTRSPSVGEETLSDGRYVPRTPLGVPNWVLRGAVDGQADRAPLRGRPAFAGRGRANVSSRAG